MMDFRRNPEDYSTLITDEDFNEGASPQQIEDEISDGFHNIHIVYILYLHIVAFNCFLISMRLIKYAGYYRKINLIYVAILEAKTLLLSSLVILFGVIM
jgi:hypothetical protein